MQNEKTKDEDDEGGPKTKESEEREKGNDEARDTDGALYENEKKAAAEAATLMGNGMM